MYILPGALAPLAQYRQFIVVKFIPKTDEYGNPVPNKTDKLPVDYRTGQVTEKGQGGAHDPAIWTDVVTAASIAEGLGANYGVGFVITDADPIACMDMDECTTFDGAWIPEVATMLAAFGNPASELSNSGRGLHGWAIYRGPSPEHGKKSKGTLDRKWLEFYTGKRFIALGATATGVMPDVTDILPAFIEKWFPAHVAGEDDIEGWTTEPITEYTHLDDDILINKALSRSRKQSAAAAFGSGPMLPSFSDLWYRNVTVLAQAFPPQSPGKEIDASDADFALAKELAYWTGKNCERIAALMRGSKLVRDKWDEDRSLMLNGDRWDTTFLNVTIYNAVLACTAVHYVKPLVAPAQSGKLAAKVIDHQTFIGRENMIALFNDCIYVQDENKILIPNGDLVDQPRFKARYAGYTFVMDNDNEKVSKDAWDAFINNSVIQFPRADGTVFDPSIEFQGTIERAGRLWVNTYKAPVIDRRPGDASRFVDLVNRLLPNGDDAIILMSYLAAVVQYPGVKFRWAPFIQGTTGNGKSTVVACLKHALGNKYIFSVKSGMIENNFNAWLENNVLYVADDIYSSKDRTDMMEALKAMITEVDQGVTYKGIDSMQKVICGNFIFTDNHKDAMQKRDDSRRICTLYCAQQNKADRIRDGLTKSFFVGPNGLVKWLRGGGYAYVAELLHTMPIDPRYNPADECQEAPDTSATHEAIVDGRTGLEHDVAEWVVLDEPGFCGDFISVHMLKRKMEAIPRHSRSMNPLKIKEMLGRLGYEIHRGLPEGRVPFDVQPDDTRPILYIKRDTWAASLNDAPTVAKVYEQIQREAVMSALSKRMLPGVSI